MACNNQFWKDRLASIEAQIVAYEEAITALATGSVLSYTLDTGQTRQTVTKFNITEMNRNYERLLSLHATICARVYGTGVVNARPRSPC